MESYQAVNSLWDLSQANTFPSLPDDDFLALLQKQFPSVTGDANAIRINGEGSVDPQTIQQRPLSKPSPSSDESSSPSPSSPNNEESLSRRPSRRSLSNGESEETAHKRKASDDDMEDEPNLKSQHTAGSSSNVKKGSTSASSRRKSSGNHQDETRLLKRKEQNRAAQRAFRERKEKHVKDLEDKVAALEAKNDQAQSENENLRDLLSRLQSENLVLKQQAFTFSAPRSGSQSSSSSLGIHQTPLNLFGPSTSTLSPSTSFSAGRSPQPTFPPQGIDWSSLTTFDPAVLSLLDETPQPTATDGTMQMDLSGYGQYSLPPPTQYKTIATNPLFMSFAESSEDANGANGANNNSMNMFNFNFQSPSSTWQSSPPTEINIHDQSLDDLFQTNFLNNQGSFDVSMLIKNSPNLAISPVSHSNMSSPSSNTNSTSNSHSPFWASTHVVDSPPSVAESEHSAATCPKTKDDMSNHIAAAGESPFAPQPSSGQKSGDSWKSDSGARNGTAFPMAPENSNNIEVLSAWRTITSNPHFKDADINELCTEFTKKAKCDGTKVVLDPQSVNHILDSLRAKQQR